MLQGAVQKVGIISVRVYSGNDRQDICHVNIHISQRDAVENLQRLLGICNIDATLLYHRREGIPNFPRNRTGADKRVSLGFSDDHRNNR